MALPKRRHSHSRTRKRRSHDALTPPTSSRCPDCSEPKQPHKVCGSCGRYKGRAVVLMADDIA